MHLTIAIIMPITIAGINKRPMPKGIKAKITTNPIIAPIIVNKTFNKTMLTFNAAIIDTKNTKIPKKTLIYLPPTNPVLL